MKTLLLVAALLFPILAEANTKTKLKPVSAPTLQVPFKIKAGVDAGTVATKVLPERRTFLLKATEEVRKAVADQVKQPVVIKAIYFAQVTTDTADAAVVVFSTGGRDTATFFVYNAADGWRQFPSDLSEYKP